jgi:hypothetical protein
MLLNLLAAAVLTVVGYRLLSAVRIAARGRGRTETLTIVGGLRPHHFLLGLATLIVVANAAFLLVQVPGLDFGWWEAIGGIGNPVTGGTEQTEGTALEWVLPLVFMLLLIPALPLLAASEERIFRLGDEERTRLQRLRRAVMFGLAHAIVGIPIGVCLALALGGWYFSWRYMRAYRRTGSWREGFLESTRSHVAYNGIIILIVLVGLALAGLS